MTDAIPAVCTRVGKSGLPTRPRESRPLDRSDFRAVRAKRAKRYAAQPRRLVAIVWLPPINMQVEPTPSELAEMDRLFLSRLDLKLSRRLRWSKALAAARPAPAGPGA